MTPKRQYRIKLRVGVASLKKVVKYADGRIQFALEVDPRYVDDDVMALFGLSSDEPLTAYIVDAFPDSAPAAPKSEAETRKKRELNPRQKLIYRSRLICDEIGWKEETMRMFFKKVIGKESRSDMDETEMKKLVTALEQEAGEERMRAIQNYEIDEPGEDTVE